MTLQADGDTALAVGYESPAQPGPAAGPPLWMSIDGRIPRSTYWLKFMVPAFGLQMAGAVLDAGTGRVPGEGMFSLLAILVAIWPTTVGVIKRLHDLGYSTELGVGMMVVGGALGVLGESNTIESPYLLLVVLPVLLTLWWFGIKISFIRGTAGPNEYGTDPLA